MNRTLQSIPKFIAWSNWANHKIPTSKHFRCLPSKCLSSQELERSFEQATLYASSIQRALQMILQSSSYASPLMNDTDVILLRSNWVRWSSVSDTLGEWEIKDYYLEKKNCSRRPQSEDHYNPVLWISCQGLGFRVWRHACPQNGLQSIRPTSAWGCTGVLIIFPKSCWEFHNCRLL